MVYSILVLLLFIAAIILFFELTPDRVTNDIINILSPDQTLYNMAKRERGKKKNKITSKILNIRKALITTGKGRTFTIICTLSLILLFIGGLFAFFIKNIFLIPILSISFAAIPFTYAQSILAYYDKHIKEEIETTLSIISTSYIRNDDIITAVRENIIYIKPPIRDIFNNFLVESTIINSDIKLSLRHLKEQIDNRIYCEWCDILIACQEDKTLKNSLLSVVNKLTDVRIINNELKTISYETKKEYWTMVALVIANIPLLYVLNKDWYFTLMNTLAGKVVLAICGVAILITTILMAKYTKPIEYKR